MKEKIDQLQKLLNEINEEIKKRLKSEDVSMEIYNDSINDLEKEFLSINSEERSEAFNKI